MIYEEWHPSLKADVQQALRNDPSFNFKEVKGDFRGNCPKCNKKEAYVKIESPFRVICRREKNCEYVRTTRELYPDLFEDFSKRYPSTPTDPEATAKGYMEEKRGFNVQLIKTWFNQGSISINGESWPTVRFYLFGGTQYYWERIIDGKAVKAFGKKAHFKAGTKYTGKYWAPKNFKIEKGDIIKVCEGVFHCIALTLAGHKAVAALSCVNFPWELLNAHKDDDITWQLALDGDNAGVKYMLKYYKQLKAQKQKAEILLIGGNGKADWDDLYKSKRLTESYIDKCLYRGRLLTSETIEEKAYHWWRFNVRRTYTILDFKNCLYRISIDKKIDDDIDTLLLKEAGEDVSDLTQLNEETIKQVFNSNCSTFRISNFFPDFRYVRNDPEDENRKLYCFKVYYGSGNFVDLIELAGSAMDGPSSFRRTILDATHGGRFVGEKKDFDVLTGKWLDFDVKRVKAIDIVGYDVVLNAYIYQDFAVKDGQVVRLNDEGYFDLNDIRVKPVTATPKIESSHDFNSDWFHNYRQVFSMFGLATLSFFAASLFVTQIKRKQAQFPFLEVTGEPQAGKTTMLKFLWLLLGRKHYEGFDVKTTTPASLARELAVASNLPVAFIESEDDKSKNDFNWEHLKPFYDFESATRITAQKNRGNNNDTKKFRGTILITQNHRVDAEKPILERIVHCNATKDHHTRDLAEVAKYFKTVELEDVSGFVIELLKHEKQFLDAYFEAFKIHHRFFVESSAVNNQRIETNHAQIVSAFDALRVILKDITPALIKELREYLLGRGEVRENLLDGDHPDIQQFWENYEYINDRTNNPAEKDGDLIGSLPDRLNHSSDVHVISIRLGEYDELCRKYGQRTIPLNDLKQLLKQSKKRPFKGRGKQHSVHLKKAVDVWQFMKGEEDYETSK